MLMLPLVSFSQSQSLNGVELNGPEGFIRTQDYQWETENDMIMVTSIKGKLTFEGKEAAIKAPSRATEFIMIRSYELNQVEYKIGYHIGDNGYLISVTIVERGEYSYFITCSTNPDRFGGELKDVTNQSFERLNFINGYMINRILIF